MRCHCAAGDLGDYDPDELGEGYLDEFTLLSGQVNLDNMKNHLSLIYIAALVCSCMSWILHRHFFSYGKPTCTSCRSQCIMSVVWVLVDLK